MSTNALIEQLGRYSNLTRRATKTLGGVEGCAEHRQYPNPHIVNELVLATAKRNVSSSRLNNKLEQGVEALRRLEVLQMNINYPVSGYRVNKSSLLQVYPSIESQLPEFRFSRRTLNIAIESQGAKTFAAVVSLILIIFSEQIMGTVINLVKRYKDAKSGADMEDTYKNIVRAMSSNKKIKLDGYRKRLLDRSPIYYKTVHNKRSAPLNEIIDAMYSEGIWGRLSQNHKNMLSNTDITKELGPLIESVSGKVLSFLSDLRTVTANTERAMRAGSGFSAIDISMLSSGHEEFIRDGIKLTERTKSLLNAPNVNKKTLTLPQYMEVTKTIQNNLKSDALGKTLLLSRYIDSIKSVTTNLERIKQMSTSQRFYDASEQATAVNLIRVLQRASAQVQNILQVMLHVIETSQNITKELIRLDETTRKML